MFRVFFELRRRKSNAPEIAVPGLQRSFGRRPYRFKLPNHAIMDLLRTKIYLDKINREYARMSKDPENIMRIDIDIMMSYVRDLYDALLSDAENPAAAVRRDPPRVSPPPAPKAAAPEAIQPPPPPKPPVAEVPPPAPPEEKPAPAPPPPPVVVEALPSAEPLPNIKPQPTAPAAPPSFPAIPPEAEGLFEHKEAKELSEKLSNMPVPDLLKAIALNDKMLLTRELFGNDNAIFEKVIATLNGFDSMDQARAYLLEHCVMRYRWTDKKRVETAKNFIKLVRRRYA